MKTFAVLCAVLAGLLVAHGDGQAQQRIKIGLIYPENGPLGDYAAGVREALIDGLGASAGRVDVIAADTLARPELAVESFRRLVDQDRVDLVVGPLLEDAARAVAQVNRDYGIPLVMLATDSLEALAAALDGNDRTVAFGRLPGRQEEIFHTLLKSAAFDTIPKAVQVIGRGNAGRRLADVLKVSIAGGVSMLGPLEPTNEPDLIPLVASDQAGVYVGISGMTYAERLYAALAAIDGRKRSMLLFSPPPPVTRAWIAGRVIDSYLQSSETFDSDGFMAAVRAHERYDPERRSLELFYSMTVYNATPETEAHIGETNALQRGNRSQDSGKAGTATCSCRDSENKLRKCIDCAEGNCEKKKDGTDNCSTSCKS